MHPILFQWGKFILPAYGVFYLAAFLAALAVGTYLITLRTDVSFSRMFDIAFRFVIAGEVGARLTYVIVEWPRFTSGSISFLQFLTSGRVVLGGVVCGVLAAYWLFKRNGIPFLVGLDSGMAAIPLGMAIGRLGCLFSGCCYGAPTDWFWGMTFTHPLAERINGTPLGIPLHPTQILQALSGFLMFGILLWLHQSHR